MPSTTAWSDYAAKQLKLPFGSYRNQMIRTEFFNTHSPSHSLRFFLMIGQHYGVCRY
jgi:hypothetical protein